MPKMTLNSTDGIPLDKRRSDRLQKDKKSLETNDSPASNKIKMVKAISSASLTSPKMRQSINFEKCKSTSKLPSLKNIETQKAVAAIENKIMSRLDGNISPNNRSPLMKQVNESTMKVKRGNTHSPTPEKNNEAGSVNKRKMLRSRSTVSLKSATPISSNKKIEKNTMSRTKSVPVLKISSEEEEAEVTIQKPMSRSVRVKALKNSCVETPTDSDKIVKKNNVPSMLAYSSGKLQKANTNLSKKHVLSYSNSNLHKKGSNGPAIKKTKSENSADSVDEESNDKHRSGNQLSKIKSQSNIQQKGLTENPLDKIKSIKLSSKIEKENKNRNYSSRTSDTKEVEPGSFDHKTLSSCSVTTQRKNVKPVYLNSSDSSLTSSSVSDKNTSWLDDNNDSKSSKRASREGLPPSKKKKYKKYIKPNNESQVSNDNKQTFKETKSNDDDSNKFLNSTKQQTYNTMSSKIKAPVINTNQSYSQEPSKEINVTDKGSNSNPKKSNLDLSEDDTQSSTMKKTSQQNDKNKLTRNSVSNVPVKEDIQKGSIHSSIYQRYLKSFTRKLHFVRAYEIGDVSECDIENVTMPEKFDLNCKVRITTSYFLINFNVRGVQNFFLFTKL